MLIWPSSRPLAIAPKVEASGVQCPKCGTHGPSVSGLRRDRATGESFHPSPPLRTTGIIGLWLSVSVVLTLATTILLGPGSLGLGLLLAGTLTIAYLVIYNWQAVQREANTDLVYQYKCRRCLHEWQWIVGHSVPRYRETQEVWDDYRSVLKDDEESGEMPSN